MSRPPILITELMPDQKVWKIAICVINLWIVKERNGQQHVEAIIHDVEGHQIHVVTRNHELDMWIQTLKEHYTYMVYNGDPRINDLLLKVCDNKFKLLFNGTTAITTIDMLEISLHKFKFKPFGDFSNGAFEVDRLYDTFLDQISSNLHLTFQQLLT
ncbi:unnamed protein product [Lathyrus oleraceus]